VKDNPDGTRALSQIQVSGKKYALEIGESTALTDVARQGEVNIRLRPCIN